MLGPIILWYCGIVLSPLDVNSNEVTRNNDDEEMIDNMMGTKTVESFEKNAMEFIFSLS